VTAPSVVKASSVVTAIPISSASSSASSSLHMDSSTSTTSSVSSALPAQPNSSNPAQNSTGSGKRTVVIVAGVLGGALFLATISLCVSCLLFHRQRRRMARPKDPEPDTPSSLRVIMSQVDPPPLFRSGSWRTTAVETFHSSRAFGSDWRTTAFETSHSSRAFGSDLDNRTFSDGATVGGDMEKGLP
jgi:hypothetical protein